MKIRASSQRGDEGKRSEKFLIVFAAMFVPLQLEDGEWKTFFAIKQLGEYLFQKAMNSNCKVKLLHVLLPPPAENGGLFI
jgi:hypothetical protein